ncbi:hypothetical protein [Sinorhizobium medicae]|uniref:hypothetical protein n=1 Tax=Sinorhizobium medicae TaxID=110321 RepID=UPI0011AB007C|nr:hypothetical protein [Sinorhizobium medicae]
MPFDDKGILIWSFDRSGLASTAPVDSRGLQLGLRSTIQLQEATDFVEVWVINGGIARISALALKSGSYAILDSKLLSSSPDFQQVVFSAPGIVRITTEANSELHLTTYCSKLECQGEPSSLIQLESRRKIEAAACDIHVFHERWSKAAKSIDDLDLVDYAKEAAEVLLETHPSVIFTSGRRTIKEQASAMAGNIVVNRKWIEQTYVKTPERDSLQKWVDDHPEATTKAAIAAGMEQIMNDWTDEQKAKLSRHFSGQAFDVRPVGGSDGEVIKAKIKGLPHLRKFLESEGGLTIWHADFEK